MFLQPLSQVVLLSHPGLKLVEDLNYRRTEIYFDFGPFTRLKAAAPRNMSMDDVHKTWLGLILPLADPSRYDIIRIRPYTNDNNYIVMTCLPLES